MTTAKRNLLGLVTVVSVLLTGPILWWISFGDPTGSSKAMDILSIFIIFHAILFWIYYRNVFKNPNVPDHKRHAWTIAIFLGLAFGQMIYYWLYVWRPALRGGAPTS